MIYVLIALGVLLLGIAAIGVLLQGLLLALGGIAVVALRVLSASIDRFGRRRARRRPKTRLPSALILDVTAPRDSGSDDDQLAALKATWESTSDEPVNMRLRSVLMRHLERQIRDRNWTRSQAADYLRVPEAQIDHIFWGNSDRLTIDTLVSLLDVLGNPIRVLTTHKVEFFLDPPTPPAIQVT